MRVAILGGGLAGCALGFILKQVGLEPVIYEANASLADGASGNVTGLYNPRFGAEWTPQSRYFSKAFELAGELLPTLEGIDYDSCGCMHLINDEKKIIRYSKMIESWGWNADDMRITSPQETSEICGIETAFEGLWLPHSGTVSPPKLCGAYTDGVEVHCDARIENLKDIQADIIILAAGPALRHFEETKHLDLRAVRGQVTMAKETPQSAAMKTNICYSGYMTKARDGMHMIGSTFQRWLDHIDAMAEDDAENISRMQESIPAFKGDFEVLNARASVRTTSKDHFPVVGRLSENLYVSTAHGSHGILSSLMAAHILRDMILDKAQMVDNEVIAAVSPQRYDAA